MFNIFGNSWRFSVKKQVVFFLLKRQLGFLFNFKSGLMFEIKNETIELGKFSIYVHILSETTALGVFRISTTYLSAPENPYLKD